MVAYLGGAVPSSVESIEQPDVASDAGVEVADAGIAAGDALVPEEDAPDEVEEVTLPLERAVLCAALKTIHLLALIASMGGVFDMCAAVVIVR